MNKKLNHEKNYPVVSNTLKPHFDIAFDVPDFKTVIPGILPRSTTFIITISTQMLSQQSCRFQRTDFSNLTVCLCNINGTSNELQFGNGVGVEPREI
ncbi:MAG: hypothetical protein IPN26_14530 [Bacteroidetes bacterium]|nr:hypothetical protein [Bacteroidota bacterium]